MYEHLSLVRYWKKDGTMTEWEPLVPPSEPIQNHIAAFNKIISEAKPGMVHDEVAVIKLGRIHDIRSDVRFKTQSQADAEAKQIQEFQERQSQTIEDARKRQEKMDAEAAERESEDKRAKIAELNKQHDAIREPNNPPQKKK